MPRRKYLYLPGFGNNADIAEMQISTLKSVLGEVEVLQGFVPLSVEELKGANLGSKDAKQQLCGLAESGVQLFAWWSQLGEGGEEAKQDAASKVHSCCVLVCPRTTTPPQVIAHINAEGIEGIIGFSQGASS